MRIAIIGSRHCPTLGIGKHLPSVPDTIVSGGARGADTQAREYAIANNIPLVEYLPDYGKYGRRAPILRNICIVENCDHLLAFWDGKSRGTKFTIDYARKHNTPVTIVRI